MSYEEEIQKTIDDGKELPKKMDISFLRYFWEVGALTGAKDTVPKFLKNISVLKNFSDHELRILSQSFHLRTFADDELIFRQGEAGIGFYFILSGNVDIIVQRDGQSLGKDEQSNLVISLERGDYFGELALLQENSSRNATAVSKGSCELFGIFKPDLDELISVHPVVAAKLLQSISVIVANRLHSITAEVRALKAKISLMEQGVFQEKRS